jgi:branched-chain amino acid transport system substrate-binding protein
MQKKALPLLIAFVVTLLFFGCSPTTNTPMATPVEQVSESETVIQAPTNTSVPTDTPIPPTETPPPPTNTPLPTDTPTETLTPSITPTFSPQTLSFSPGAPVRIGTLLWETNPIGIDSLRGVEIALSDFGGEILGHPIELLSYDEECNEVAGQRGAQILALDDSVVGVIGTTCSRAALIAAKAVSDKGKVMISPSNSNPEYTAPESHESGYFRTYPNDIQALKATTQYAYNELGSRKLASLYIANDKVQTFWDDHLCQLFINLGGECVLERAVPAGTTFLAPVINALLEAAPDLIHLTFWDAKDAASLIAEIRNTPELAGVNIAVWEALNNPNFLTEAGENVVGVYVSTTQVNFEQDTLAYQTLFQTYQANFGEEPLSIFHAYAYDAATLLLRAINQVAVLHEDGSLSVDPLAVRDVLYATVDFPGVTGSLTCSPYGDCSGVQGGNLYQFTSSDPESFNPGPADSPNSNPSQVWP